MKSHFFAYLMRMKNIKRWGLMRNTEPENIKEHSLDVAFIAHALAAAGNSMFERNCNVERIVMLAVYHDVSEVMTGDMPTPIKYFDPEIKKAYKKIEAFSTERLKAMLPPELRSSYSCLDGSEDEYENAIVKAADKISAYFKCIEELNSGNREFATAKDTLFRQIKELGLPETDYFMETFAESIGLTLDELK